jgi:hypothetical protein
MLDYREFFQIPQWYVHCISPLFSFRDWTMLSYAVQLLDLKFNARGASGE